MKGTWNTTGPGRGTWQTDGSNVPWPLVNAGVLTVLIAAGAAGVGKAAWHDRAELGLIYAAGIGVLVVAVTATMLLYRWLHPAVQMGRVALPAGRAATVTATVVPRVPAADVPQALPAPADVGKIHDAMAWLDGEITTRAKYIREIDES